MITIELAKTLKVGDILTHDTAKLADGKTPQRCRVNGKCKTWVTRPTEFKLPVMQGLRHAGYITEFNAADWSKG